MNYETEAANLRESQWLKLEEGNHKLVILADLSDLKTETKMIRGEQKTLTQSELMVEYQGQRFKWSVTKGISPTSLWGQLVRLGKAWESLVGKEIDVIVKGTGKEKDYTITQALGLDTQKKLD